MHRAGDGAIVRITGNAFNGYAIATQE